MSATADSHTVEVERAQQKMNWPWIVGVGVASVVIFAVATLWSTHILNTTRSEMQPAGPPPIPKEVNQYEVGIVNLRVFALDQRAAQKRLRQMERLDSYGWVDRETGVAHIPVSEAMKMLVAEEKGKK